MYVRILYGFDRCRKSRSAFTLIELLIVVAIIAILAAIAVPNFLEAQTRSKVARVRADLRALATALESYYVDNNSYTGRNQEGDHPGSAGSGHSSPWLHGFAQLTSPVSYMTAIPDDPFGGSRIGTRPQDWRGPGYGRGVGVANGRIPVGGWPMNRATDCWMLESDGPDRWDDTQGNFSTSNFPWPALDPNNLNGDVGSLNVNQQVITVSALLYDPTNGTVSVGEIMRFGGQKPNGQVYTYLWSNSFR